MHSPALRVRQTVPCVAQAQLSHGVPFGTQVVETQRGRLWVGGPRWPQVLALVSSCSCVSLLPRAVCLQSLLSPGQDPVCYL